MIHVWFLFLRRDLKSVDRCRTPWLFGGTHRPIYVSKLGEDRLIAADLRAGLEQTLLDFRVNAMFYGHTHFYERTCVQKAGVCVPESEGGVLHLTVGTGGHMTSSDRGLWEPWKVYSEVTYG